MVATIDGHNLSIGDKCLSILFKDDSEYIESLTECIYKGFWIKDNKPYIASLPSICSGVPIPETQIMHDFEPVGDINQKFSLLEDDIAEVIIKDSSSIEEIVVKRLKN